MAPALKTGKVLAYADAIELINKKKKINGGHTARVDERMVEGLRNK